MTSTLHPIKERTVVKYYVISNGRTKHTTNSLVSAQTMLDGWKVNDPLAFIERHQTMITEFDYKEGEMDD